jgi:hypothetical protein
LVDEIPTGVGYAHIITTFFVLCFVSLTVQLWLRPQASLAMFALLPDHVILLACSMTYFVTYVTIESGPQNTFKFYATP